MTELEKLFCGLPFDARNPDIVKYGEKVNDICFELNQLKPSDPTRKERFQELFGSYNLSITVEPGFRCVYGKNIHFKGYAYVNYDCIFLDTNIITIGDRTLIGPKCSLICTNHAIDKDERMAGLFNKKPITIGDYVWLGAAVVVCPGVSIGDGSIIGAGSVVTKDIPPNVVAAGSPCKVIREITEADKLNNTR